MLVTFKFTCPRTYLQRFIAIILITLPMKLQPHDPGTLTPTNKNESTAVLLKILMNFNEHKIILLKYSKNKQKQKINK